MPCSINIDDGTDSVLIDQAMTSFRLAFAPVSGGANILRFLNGGAKPQTRWSKEKLTVYGENDAPSELRGLDYTQDVLTVTAKRGADTFVFSCTSLGVQETWDYSAGKATWTLILEET